MEMVDAMKAEGNMRWANSELVVYWIQECASASLTVAVVKWEAEAVEKIKNCPAAGAEVVLVPDLVAVV